MKKILYTVFMILAVSCVESDNEGAVESRLDIKAEIDRATASRAVLEGTDFETGNTMGIFIYHSETESADSPEEMSAYSLYGTRYRNIRAVYNEDLLKWRFNFEDAVTSFDEIYLLRPTIEAFESGLAVLAYAPWMEYVPSITQIPFELGGKSEDMMDLMWARQNTHDAGLNPIDPGRNYKIVPDGNVKPVQFTFRHALSQIRVGFRCLHEGSLMTVTSITLRKKAGGTTPLIGAGQFNAMTGGFGDVDESAEIVYDYTDKAYNFQSTSDYMYVPMLIFPQKYEADGDYVLEFTFNGQEISSKYEVRMSDVAGGFRSGYVYTFNFTIDNYIQFDGVEVSTEWVELETNRTELKF